MKESPRSDDEDPTKRSLREPVIRAEGFAALAEQSADFIAIATLKGEGMFVNPAGRQLVELPLREVRKTSLQDFVPPEDRNAAEEFQSRALREGRHAGAFRFRNLRTGAVIPVWWSMFVLRDEKTDEAIALASVVRDITEENRADTRLRLLAEASALLASSLEYEATLASVAHLAVPLFADWCCVAIFEETGDRRRLREVCADARQAPIEAGVRHFSTTLEGASAFPLTASLQGPVLLKEISPESLRSIAASEERFVDMCATGLQSLISVPLLARGRALGVMSFGLFDPVRRYDRADLATATALADRAAHSIDSARLYAEAEAKTAKLEEAERRKDEFLAMLGHELRNPLAAVTSALDLLEREQPAATRAKLTAICRRQGSLLIRLVDDLLDVSRLTRGKVEIERQTIDLSSCLEGAILATRQRIADGNQQLDAPLESAPLCWVRGDAGRLEQVFGNLLGNAAKFTGRGGRISLRLTREETARQPWAVIEVRDSGRGIDADLLPRIFDLFVQGDQPLDRSNGGLGIGLTLARDLVRLHAGTLEAHSAGAGQGATFIVRLPIVAPDPLDDTIRVVERLRRRLVIVEDNDDAREVLEALLQDEGHEVHTAKFGAQGRDLIVRVRPDVAFVDIGLPDLDGYEVAREVRALYPEAYLVALTGYGGDGARASALAAGFQDHLTKPLTDADFQRVLREL